MKTVAYLRVSTGSQDLATQKLAILDFTQKRRFTVDAFIESRISSRKSPIERRIEEMLGTLQSGDRLLVSELSRLGPQPLSGYWARKSRRPQLPRSWTSPVPPSTTSSRRARSGQADEKARLGQPRPYVVFQHQSGRYPNRSNYQKMVVARVRNDENLAAKLKRRINHLSRALQSEPVVSEDGGL